MKNKILLLSAMLLTVFAFGCANDRDPDGLTIINYNINTNDNTLSF